MNFYQKFLILSLIIVAAFFMQNFNPSGFYARIVSPTVTSNNLVLVYINPTGAVFTSNLEITNPTDYPMNIEIVSYRVFLNSKEVGWGQKFSDIVPSKSVRTYKPYVSIPFNENLSPIDVLNNEIIFKLDIDYDINGLMGERKSFEFVYNTTFQSISK